MSTKRIINVIKEKCKEAPERAPDYHEALLDTVSEIIWAEYQHAIRATSIQKAITDSCEALGDYIHRNTSNEDENK